MRLIPRIWPSLQLATRHGDALRGCQGRSPPPSRRRRRLCGGHSLSSAPYRKRRSNLTRHRGNLHANPILTPTTLHNAYLLWPPLHRQADRRRSLIPPAIPATTRAQPRRAHPRHMATPARNGGAGPMPLHVGRNGGTLCARGARIWTVGMMMSMKDGIRPEGPIRLNRIH